MKLFLLMDPTLGALDEAALVGPGRRVLRAGRTASPGEALAVYRRRPGRCAGRARSCARC